MRCLNYKRDSDPDGDDPPGGLAMMDVIKMEKDLSGNWPAGSYKGAASSNT